MHPLSNSELYRGNVFILFNLPQDFAHLAGNLGSALAVDGTADRCAIGFVASDVDALPASIRTFADAAVVVAALGGV